MIRFLVCVIVFMPAQHLCAAAPQTKISDPEQLVAQLGDRQFVVRQSARKKLLALEEEAIAALSIGSSHPDPTIRDEVESIRKEIAIDAQRRQLERALTKLKEGRVDCAVDALSRIRCSEYDDHVWQAVLDAGWGLAGRIKTAYPGSNKFGEEADYRPDVRPAFRPPATNYAEFLSKKTPRAQWSAGTLTRKRGQSLSLAQAQRINVEGMVSESVALCNGPIDVAIGSCNDSVLLVNGDISIPYAVNNSILVCDGSVKMSAINRSIVITSGRLVGSRYGGRDLNISQSAVITGGSKPEGNTTIDKGLVKFDEPTGLKFIKWFAVSEVGFEVSSVPKGAKIDKLADGSLPARSGFKPGDQITVLDGTPIDSAESFRRALRRVITSDRCVITIERDGKPSELVLNFRAEEKAKLKEAKSRP